MYRHKSEIQYCIPKFLCCLAARSSENMKVNQVFYKFFSNIYDAIPGKEPGSHSSVTFDGPVQYDSPGSAKVQTLERE